jgi:hypothetical protein
MMLRQRLKSWWWSPLRTVEGWNTPAGMTPIMPPEVAALRL